MTLPALALVTSGALSAVVEIAEGLEIDVERLRANLEMTGGQIMAEAVSFALAEKIGRAEAHALVQELSRQAVQEKRPLKEVLLVEPAREMAVGRQLRSRSCSSRSPTRARPRPSSIAWWFRARCGRRAGRNPGRRAVRISGPNPGCRFHRRSGRSRD